MPRTSSAALALGLALLVGTMVVLVAALVDDRQQAFTLGVRPLAVAVRMPPGTEACQLPVDVSTDFSAVRFRVSTQGGPPGPLITSVRDVRDGRALGTAKIAGSYRDGGFVNARVGTVREGARVAVCVLNAGRRALGLYGGGAIAARSSVATLNGRERPADLSFEFERRREVSALSLVPVVLRRMALFRPGFVGAWTYWLLLALLLAGAPALLALALRSSQAAD